MNRRLAEARLAFMLLTRIPMGTLGQPVPAMAQSAWAYPVVGLAVGTLTGAGLVASLGMGLPPYAAAVLALALSALLTGAMHEDGLADSADGFGGGRNRDRKLEIMRDSHIGSYGVLALVLSTLLRVALLASIAAASLSGWQMIGILAAGAAASRSTLPAVMHLLPPARQDGLGRSASGIEAWQAMIASGLGVAALAIGWPSGTWLAGCLGLAATTTLIAWLSLRQIGGFTGDTLGATQIGCELALLAMLVPHL